MEVPKVITLSHSESKPSFSIKLNNDILQQFRACIGSKVPAKLVVKNGQYSIKINDSVFPCTNSPEYSSLDIFTQNTTAKTDFSSKNPDTSYTSVGRIHSKLSVITDPKQIEKFHASNTNNVKDLKVQATAPASPASTSASTSVKNANRPSLSSPATPLNFDPYLATTTDTKQDLVSKFLFFMALGPSTKTRLTSLLKFKGPMVDELLANFCQIYNPNDTFLVDDVFPNNVTVNDSDHYILKDKAYKELRPWEWKYYSDNERGLIINNVHHALTRQGYSETHPLRKKIVEKPFNSGQVPNSDDKKHLGGGFLTSRKTFKRSQTESPKLAPTTGSSIVGSPLKNSTASNPKKRQLSNNSVSSSDDDVKRSKKEDYTSPSSVDFDEGDESDESDRSKTNYYENLTLKFKLKYKEYLDLYNSLQGQKSGESKKTLNRLFELHQSLQDWKKQLWAYDTKIRSRNDINHLSKHKKSAPKQEIETESTKPKKSVKMLNY